MRVRFIRSYQGYSPGQEDDFGADLAAALEKTGIGSIVAQAVAKPAVTKAEPKPTKSRRRRGRSSSEGS